MTMPSDVESPMYTTASQEVRVAGAAFGDAPFGDAAFGGSALCDFVACVGEEEGGAAGAWCVEILISAGAFARCDEPLSPSAPGPITPARPAPSSARTPSAATETTPAATRCRFRRR